MLYFIIQKIKKYEYNEKLQPREILHGSVFTTSTDKIFEKNSSFHVNWCTTGRVQFLFSKSLLLVLTKSFLGEEDWVLGYTSMKF